MKPYAMLLCLLTLSGIAGAQTKNEPEEVVRRVADYIIQNTSFKFVNTKTGQKYDSTKGLASSTDIKADSKFNKWMYVNGVMTMGMMEMSKTLNDKKYSDYSRKNFDFIFSNIDYFKKQYDAKEKPEFGSFFRTGSLDDCGAMSAGLLEVYALDKKKEYMDYLQRVSNHVLSGQVRLPDGTLTRTSPRKYTIWADDLFMSVPYLARMGKLTGDQKYFDDAIKQVENFNKYLYDPSTGLYLHAWYSDVNMNGVARWGRCNGWVAVAQAELLSLLPENHPKRPELIRMLLRQIVGFSRYQDISGLWHQVLDRPDSYQETSVTAMFVYTVAKAVNQGWINPRYLTIAQNGWNALAAKINPDGQMQDVCIGTSIEEDIRYYYNRPKELNDTHGLGAMLLAGSEIIKAKQKMVDIEKRR